MTNEQQKAKKLAELLTAFADGKQLQYEDECDGTWEDCILSASLNGIMENFASGFYFRIKPETKRVPLTMQDLIDRIKEDKTMWIALTDGGICQQITSFSWVYFTTNVGTYNYDQLAEKFTFLDDTPCYKEVNNGK